VLSTVPLTPTGFTASTPRRRGHSRRTALIIAVVVAVLAAAAGGAYLLKTRSDARTADRKAAAAARGYLDAWRALDAPADDAAGGRDNGATRGQAAVTAASVAGDVDVPKLVSTMVDVRERLRVTGATYTPGTLHRSGDTATVPYTASLTLSALPSPLTYTGELYLTKVGGDWKISARLASVHPALKPGLHLDRGASTANRGALLDAHGQQLATDADLAGNLVGRVAPVSGLQRVYDSRLAPQGGTVVVKDAANRTVQTLQSYPMTDGGQVTTTIDLSVQRAGEAAMAAASRPTGALVAIDTRTGGVLALVNHPPNGFGRAVRGAYPPGSTFKIITATAALMSGKSADTPLDCTQNVTVGGRTIQNAEAEQFGVIPLRTAFARSCNTAFIRLEQSLPAGALAQAAKLYGFDGTPPMPIASVGGSFPTPRDSVEAASAAIGQGRVAASPLQMASVAAAVASGTWRQPFVVGSSPRSNPLPPAAVPVLRDFMRAVVTEGTAKDVRFAGNVYGKTGTAEYADGNPPPTHGWFVGYRGNIAFAVIVEDGGFGATSAAPVAAAFLAALGT
jgi:Penicillin binding protein transpeptidase domain